MTGVDDRVVAMQFDNASFEQKLATTIQSLDKLRASLDFANSKRSLDDLSSAGKNFSMGGVGEAAEGISKKFLALATIGVTALSTITRQAVVAGERMMKSFTTGPIIAGFHEMETNMNAIQTVLANTSSKGSTLEDVNVALQELNTYSDKTIYNFSEMARNIGTFTAAGVDLKASTSAIKGIANLAAVSGSSADQASTAMYQLSQAMAAGSVKLMDWNSVVNAGMGGEVFQKSLWNTGKALGTIKNIPMNQTFDEWKKAGNSFRESLQEGWITTDVLTKTLAGFTGDLTEAQVMSMGYTKAQAAEIVKMGGIAQDAATKVKTFSQLVDTVKEAVGSGWTQTFQILLGNFDEAKSLFTDINNGIGTMVSASAKARNDLLQGWKDMGGRLILIEGVKNAIAAIGSIIKPIKEAFRQIFPPETAENLFAMTLRFAEFTAKLKIGADTAFNIRRMFAGFFSAIQIGIEVFKGIGMVIGDVFKALAPAGSGILKFGADTGDMLTRLNQALVAGGGIHDFFVRVSSAITTAIGFLKDFKEKLVAFFSVGIGKDAISGSVEHVQSRLDSISDTVDKVKDVWKGLEDRLQGVFRVLDKVWGYIKTWFSELGAKIAASFAPGDFDAAVDILNVGILGGIALMLKKFMSGGLSSLFGTGKGNILTKISQTFDQLTSTLKAMQTQLKADALIKIAAALAILTASIVVLSLIDSDKLTKALVAITVGFGELIGAMTLMDKLVGSTGAAVKVGILGAALIGIATAIAILSLAIKNLSGLSLTELAKGLTGVGVGLGILVAAVKLISGDSAGLISAGLAMIAMSTALLILSKAVESFATMSWGEMAKGLTGVAVGLGLIVLAMKFMPPSSVLSGIGFIEMAAGLLILSKAVQSFGNLSWEVIGKGLIGIAGGLLIIAAAMRFMPRNLPITATGILILSVALNIMGKAIESIGGNDFVTIAKGIGAIGAMLLILVVAMNKMQGTVAGAAALVVVSGALLILTKVLEELGKMKLTQLVTALGAIAAVLLVLGLAAHVLAPLTPALTSLGVALTLIGGAFALFGLGAMLVVKALEMLGKAGEAGAKAIVAALKIIIDGLPDMAAGAALFIVKFAEELLKAVPLLVKLMTVVLEQLLDTIIKLTPKIAEAFGEIITAGLKLIREKFPDLLKTGLECLLTFLKGIRDNIKEISTLGFEIITGFVSSLVSNMPQLVGSAVNLITSFITELGKHAGEIIAAGAGALASFLKGIADNLGTIIGAVASVIGSFITNLDAADIIEKIVTAGAKVLTHLLEGFGQNLLPILTAVAGFIGEFIKDLDATDVIEKIITAGAKVLEHLLKGLGQNALPMLKAVAKFIDDLGAALEQSQVIEKLIGFGAKVLVHILKGLTQQVPELATNVTTLLTAIMTEIGKQIPKFAESGATITINLLNDMAAAIRRNSKGMGNAIGNLASAMVSGLGDAFVAAAKRIIKDRLPGPLKGFVDLAFDVFKVSSPSKVFYYIGEMLMVGLGNGITENVYKPLSRIKDGSNVIIDTMASKMSDSVEKIAYGLSFNPEFNPTITPILDLTKIQSASKDIQSYMKISKISPEVSFQQARLISTSAALKDMAEVTVPYTGPTEITFEQNNYSPLALTTNDIYRNTRSQIALAKEELGIS